MDYGNWAALTNAHSPRNTTENMNVTKVPCFGGYARVLERANQIRSEVPDSLFLNAGDEFQGTLFFRYAFPPSFIETS